LYPVIDIFIVFEERLFLSQPFSLLKNKFAKKVSNYELIVYLFSEWI